MDETREGGGVSQPSIPKSSVNFFTFSRSSVLTVGRVVDKERSMSDWRGDKPKKYNFAFLTFPVRQADDD